MTVILVVDRPRLARNPKDSSNRFADYSQERLWHFLSKFMSWNQVRDWFGWLEAPRFAGPLFGATA